MNTSAVATAGGTKVGSEQPAGKAGAKPARDPGGAADAEADVATSKKDDALELSENEKALIKAASSLTASPEDILTAMQLAAQKGKDVHSEEEDQEPET